MNHLDAINAAFEFGAGIMRLNHCRITARDKAVKGVSLLSTIFMMLWGFWNLYYYPALDQILSFCGGLLIVAANTLWVALMLKYRGARA
jgi:hypothetical protein